MQRKRKKRQTEDDLLDLAYYAMNLPDNKDVSSFRAEKTSSVQPRQVPREAQEKIDQLIQQDIADVYVRREVTSTESRAAGPVAMGMGSSSRHGHYHDESVVGSGKRSSAHVVDLRKHYLISKYNMHAFERPRKTSFFSDLAVHIKNPFARRRERIEWHIPSRKRQEKSETEIFRDLEEDVPKTARRIALFSLTHHMRIRMYAVVLLILVLTIPAVIFAQGLYNSALSQKNQLFQDGIRAVNEITHSFSQLEKNDFSAAVASAKEAHESFNKINDTLSNYGLLLSEVAPHLPKVGSTVELARASGIIGAEVSQILSIISSRFEADQGSFATDSLQDLATHLHTISDTLIGVKDDIEGIDASDLPPEYRESFAYFQSNIEALIDGAKFTEKALLAGYTLLGGDSYRRYLVLFQNNRELRPTGGFIGSYALIDLSKGELQSMEFPGGGTYDLTAAFNENLIPPKPLSIVNKKWYMWDANWWFDFPTSAKKIAWFYEKSGGPTVDGIIAINSDIMPELLRLYGPVEMPEYGVTVTAENFYDVIQTEVEVNYNKELNQPKKILGDMFPILWERVLTSQDIRSMLALVSSGLANRDIQIALLGTEAADISHLGWDGKMAETGKDYLAVVSTNIAGGKSDASIYQTIKHHLTVNDAGEYIATVSIDKEHRADPRDQFAYVKNVDYMRFYVPQGSQLISASGFLDPPIELYREPDDIQKNDPDVFKGEGKASVHAPSGVVSYDELGKTVFAHWMQVEPGERATTIIQYKLPFTVQLKSEETLTNFLVKKSEHDRAIDHYSLYVQMQSGKRNVLFNSTVRLSDKFSIAWSDATNPKNKGGDDRSFSYSAPLVEDVLYGFLIVPGTIPN